MRRLFLSDVHLSPRWPERTERFRRFLEEEAAAADEVYILGDLFDYWIGPKHVRRPDYREALEALRQTVERGVRVFFLKGNRDFYLKGSAEASGIAWAEMGVDHRLAVGGRQVYLCHGDYLEGRRGLGFRIQEAIRSRPVEWVWTRLPAVVADLGARFYRWVSGRKGRRPRQRALHLGAHGLADDLLLAEFRRGTDIIICGHVHVPQEVPFQVDGRETVLFTVGDWADGASFVEEREGQWRLCGEGRGDA